MTDDPTTTNATSRRASRLRGIGTGIRRVALAFYIASVALALSPAHANEPASQTLPVLLDIGVPEYPPEAKTEGLSGDVVVRVHIDASGTVTEARPIEGPEVFHASAVAATATLRFEPATLHGKPAPSRMDVLFHFEPPSRASDGADIEITVEATSPDLLDTHSRETLDAHDLEKAAGSDLAETVAAVAGVSLSRGTADASKPIIRGQHERRLLLMFDGIRHEGQKWGVDHAPEIDPFAAGTISVVKGAAGVHYGPDAIGGVILVDPPAMRTERGFGGHGHFVGSTNGGRMLGGARFDIAPARMKEWSFRLQGNYGQGGDQSTPDYVLGNTASQTYNLGATAQWQRESTTVKVDWRRYSLHAGVFFGVQNSTPEDLAATVAADRPLRADEWTSTYAIERPRQQVTHDVASVRSATVIDGIGTFEATYAFQVNHREEFDRARQSITGPQFDFRLRSHTLSAEYRHAPIEGRGITIDGNAGILGMLQQNVFAGLPLIPNYEGRQMGAHVFERISWRKGAAEFGARYDRLFRTAYFTDTAFARHVGRGTLSEDDCDVVDGVAQCPAPYQTASVSAGMLWRAVPDRLDVKLDLSSASRFPNADELYLNGTTPTFPVFALGNPSLGVETTWGASPTLGVRLPWLHAEVSGFANYTHQFIQFAPEIRDDGTPAFDVTIRGTFPRFAFNPMNAWFYGGDGRISITPDEVVGAEVRAALVRAVEADTRAFLVGIPPDHGSLSLIGRPRWFSKTLEDTEFELSLHGVARQRHVDPALEFAAPPPGYVLVDARFGTEIELRNHTLSVGIDIFNVLNTRYREYASLLRYYGDQPGRDVRLRLGLDF